MSSSPESHLAAAPSPSLPSLTDEQIATWTREQKDQWWLSNVYRGDMPQLTLRAAVTGFLLGSILSATNLYIGAKTGWSLGVGLTSVILAFAAFKALARMGARDMTILENNCTQSIATAAGYMTGPMISGFAAYMLVQNAVMPMWQMMVFNVVLSILGVLVAFPMKRRFINDEQQPFPEGRACGVVLDTLYTSSAAVGLLKAKALGIAAGAAGLLKLISGEALMKLVQERWLGLSKAWHLNEHLDAWYYRLAEKGAVPIPKLSGVDIRQLGISPTLDVALFGAGALSGLRATTGMLIGMILNFVVLVPMMIARGDITPRADGTFSRVHVVNTWALWWGVAAMVVASLAALFAKPKVILSAFSGLLAKRASGTTDVLKHIELPLPVSFIGIPLVGAVGVWMAHAWFGVRWDLGALAIPLILVLTLIAANSTALTSITPTGSLSKVPQFTFGALDPKHPGTNLVTALMCTEVASNASNLLMDIKPGYMLGAKPRQQAVGHVIGIAAGALAATPLFYVLFLSRYTEGGSVMDAMVSDQFAFPSALQWKGISDLIRDGIASLKPSAQLSMGVAAALALIFEALRIATKGRFPLSGLTIGLGVVLPVDSTIAMFAGAVFFTIMRRIYGKEPGSRGHLLWVESQEPICAGLIAGFALVGIADIVVNVFVLGG